jgi:hypothetical protein
MERWESTYSHDVMVSMRSRFLANVWRRARPPPDAIVAKFGGREDRSPGLGSDHAQGELSPCALEPTPIPEWARRALFGVESGLLGFSVVGSNPVIPTDRQLSVV